MFMDAMLYTSVAHNMSHGIGSFWSPYFDAYNIANLHSFHEQPPLVFWIQSLFFRVLGDSRYVERFYVLCTMLLSLLLIVSIWFQSVNDKAQARSYAWLPVLLWITIPVCFWSYSNNMHENTMGIFILCSVLMSYKAMQSDRVNYVSFFIAGFFICLAVLSKGFPGFFPMVVPLLHWFIIRKQSLRVSLLATLCIATTVVVVGIALYIYPDAHESLSIYLFKRALQRINEVPSVSNRFFILGRLFSELIPLLSLTVLIAFITKRYQLQWSLLKNKQALFFLALGLCGSLPLMLTMVQNGFYFVPSLPYFGIGFALLFVPVLSIGIKKIPVAWLNGIQLLACLLLVFSLVFTGLQRNKYSRDQSLLDEVAQLGSIIPPHTRINCTPALYQDWSLNCYLVRMHFISLNNIAYEPKERTYLLTEINSGIPDSLQYNEIKLHSDRIRLFRHR